MVVDLVVATVVVDGDVLYFILVVDSDFLICFHHFLSLSLVID